MYYHYLAQTNTLKVSFTILGCTAGSAGRLDATKEMNSTSQTEANATKMLLKEGGHK